MPTFPSRPFVYLDQWAYSKFTKDPAVRSRLLGILKRGTLMFSMLNLVETARARGATVADIAAFLDEVGAQWAPIHLNARTVEDRERGLVLDPWRDDVVLPHLLRAPRVEGRLGALVERVQEPWMVEALADWERQMLDVAAIIESARARSRDGSLVLDGTNDVPTEATARTVFATVMQRYARSDLPLDRNQVDDALHACVPAAYCDAVFLDRRTKNLLVGIPIRGRVFQDGESEAALDWLEQAWGGSKP